MVLLSVTREDLVDAGKSKERRPRKMRNPRVQNSEFGYAGPETKSLLAGVIAATAKSRLYATNAV
jgi:hypothetical protein